MQMPPTYSIFFTASLKIKDSPLSSSGKWNAGNTFPSHGERFRYHGDCSRNRGHPANKRSHSVHGKWLAREGSRFKGNVSVAARDSYVPIGSNLAAAYR